MFTCHIIFNVFVSLILSNKCRVPTSIPMEINMNVSFLALHLPQVPTPFKVYLQPLST